MLPPRELKARVQARLGTTLLGKYRLDSVLGVGGMAAVYAATHRNTKRVALKVLHPELSANLAIRTHFQREGYAANSVGHWGTVKVDDDDVTEDGTVFIVMELLEGLGVEELRRRLQGRLSVESAVAIVEQVLDVLVAAHGRQVVHRDIKPQNLFLLRDGSLKVLDFGIARVRDAARSEDGQWTGTGELLGTPGFMAPEQALGRSDAVDAQTDVWAASATLFNLISGELAHVGTNPQELQVCAARDEARRLKDVVPQVPATIASVVDRGLAFRKDARWSTAEEMLAALREAWTTTFGGAPESPCERTWQAPSSEGAGTVAPTYVFDARPGETHSEPLPKTTTDRPVASEASGGQPRGKTWLAPMLLAVLALLLGGLATVKVLRPQFRAPIGAAAPAPAPTSSTPLVTADPPSEPAPKEAETSLPPPPPLAAVDAGSSRKGLPSAATLAMPWPSARNCNPPTTIDDAGIKHPKAWCL